MIAAATATTAPSEFKTPKPGRPEEFNDSRQQTYVGLVGAGLSRRQAAIYLGFSPSTVTKRLARDPLLADRLRKAELERQFGLLQRMMRQSERSWRAAAWLLERIHPEVYAKGKAAARPSLDEVFDKVAALVGEVVGDERVRRELEERLSLLAAEELADVACPLPAVCDFESPEAFDRGIESDVPLEPISVPELMNRSAEAAEKARDDEEWQRDIERRRSAARRQRRAEEFVEAGLGSPTASVRPLPPTLERPDSPPRGGLDALLASRHDLPAVEPPEFFNTSRTLHEKRVLKNITG